MNTTIDDAPHLAGASTWDFRVERARTRIWDDVCEWSDSNRAHQSNLTDTLHNDWASTYYRPIPRSWFVLTSRWLWLALTPALIALAVLAHYLWGTTPLGSPSVDGTQGHVSDLVILVMAIVGVAFATAQVILRERWEMKPSGAIQKYILAVIWPSAARIRTAAGRDASLADLGKAARVALEQATLLLDDLSELHDASGRCGAVDGWHLDRAEVDARYNELLRDITVLAAGVVAARWIVDAPIPAALRQRPTGDVAQAVKGLRAACANITKTAA